MYGCPCGDGPCDGTARKRNCAHVGGGAARTEKPLEFPQRFGRTIHVLQWYVCLQGKIAGATSFARAKMSAACAAPPAQQAA